MANRNSNQKKARITIPKAFALFNITIILIFAGFIGTGKWFSGKMYGLGDAINLAGSERMRVFQILLYLKTCDDEPTGTKEECFGHVHMELARFEEILSALQYGSAKYHLDDVSKDEVDKRLASIQFKWEEQFEPWLTAIISASPAIRKELIARHRAEIHDFVETDINEVVIMFSQELEHYRVLFITYRYILTIAGVLFIAFNIFYIKRRILNPITILMKDTEEVAKGNYTVRSAVPTSNELMLLAGRFNALTETIAGTFEEMETTIQKRTSELSLANEKMKTFFDSVPDAIISIDATDRSIVLFSKGAEKTFGYKAEEVLGKNVAILMPEPYQSHHEVYVQAYLGTGVKKLIGTLANVKAKKKNGDIFDVEISISESRTPSGHLFIGIVRDISAVIHARKEMMQLTNAIEQSAESLVITDSKGAIEYVNPSFERLSGYSKMELLGKNTRLFKSGKHSLDFYKELWATILGGNVWHGEFINKKKSGELYHEETTIAPVKNEEGEIINFISLKRDITAKKLAEAELANKNREIAVRAGYDRTFAKAGTILSSIFDRELVLKKVLALIAEELSFVSSAFYSYDEWSGSLVCIASHGISRTFKREFELGEGIVGQCALDASAVLIEDAAHPPLAIETGIADIAPCAVIAQPIFYQEKLKGVLVLASTKVVGELEGSFVDKLAVQLGIALNSLKQYNDLKELSRQLKQRGEEISRKNIQLEESNKMKSEFLANMSHELRTPLNAIIGFSEVLKDGILGELDPDQKEYINDIFTSGQHLLSLINDILDLSKIEAGKMSLDLDEAFIPDILENSMSIIKEKALAQNLHLSLSVQEGIAYMFMDVRKFKQIVYNLLSNAVKFTNEGGSVSLKAAKVQGGTGDMLEITVTDTGIGMASEDLGKLFRPFEQLDGSISRKYEGTGLGLAMVKRLAELHGGSVIAASEAGKGSTFTVVLPYRLSSSRPALSASSITGTDGTRDLSDTPQKALRYGNEERPLILIVEHDDMASELMHEQLAAEGYRTAMAATVQEGLAMAGELLPDLIVVEIMIPPLNGWELIDGLKAREDLARIPVVIVSIDVDENKGVALGASKMLQKPVKREDLLQAVNELGLVRSSPQGQLTVLVIDDDPAAIEIITIHLEKLGYKTIPAYSGQEGIQSALANKPDLIFLDLMMPEMTGFDVVEVLRTKPQTAQIPIIILTAKIITEEDRRMLDHHVHRIMQKGSFREQDLALEVRRSLLGRRAGAGRHISAAAGRTVLQTADRQGPASPAKASPLVLIVEDSAVETDIVSTYFEDEGYRIQSASHAREAMEIAFSHRPDLVVLDLTMPDLEGFAFLEQKALDPDLRSVPLLIAPTLTEEGEGIVLGVAAIVQKPVARDDLLEVVSAIGLRSDRHGTLKALLIDDDRKSVNILSSFFESNDCEVIAEYSGKEGLESAVRDVPDFIILDLVMPGMDGLEVLYQLKKKEETKAVPVIIMTTKVFTDEEKEYLLFTVEKLSSKECCTREAYLSEAALLLL